MIIVGLKGGLGNQMFQYAAGRRLAWKLGVELKLDLSWFRIINEKDRPYGLWAFYIEEKIATKKEVFALARPGLGISARVLNKLFGHILKQKPSHIKEKHYHFDPEILDLGNNVYLDGYWQSEKYFLDIKETIRKEFTLKTPLAGMDREIADEMSSFESVAIGIRRGDFINRPSANRFHGVYGRDYYLNCVSIISQEISKPRFFVFGNDPAWARGNIKLPFPTVFVTHNLSENKPHEDIRLMSLCKHFIISNSSFYWWGAWLSSHEKKIVIAPQKWVNDPSVDISTIIPANWSKA